MIEKRDILRKQACFDRLVMDARRVRWLFERLAANDSYIDFNDPNNRQAACVGAQLMIAFLDLHEDSLGVGDVLGTT